MSTAPIASLISTVTMRRSLVGARATDPVLPEPARRARRAARTGALRATPAAGPEGHSVRPDPTTARQPGCAAC